MQKYIEISAETPMLNSLRQLLDNDKTAISCHAGNAFPAANLIPGMLCFRQDEDKLYQLKADGTTWGSVADFTPVNEALALKADAKATTEALALKADKSAVNEALALKADSATVNEALTLKANLASPTLTGTPKAPTAASGTNTTQIATTAFVKTAVDSAVSGLLGGAPAAALDTLKELGDALGNDANFASTMTTKLSEKVNKAGDTMTGNLTAPTFIGALQGKATSAGSADTAATATKLATARTINGVAFDGTANITVADSTKLPLTGGTLSGNLTLKGQAEHQILLAEGGGYVYGNASSVGFYKTGDSTKSLRVDLTTGAVTNGAGVWTGDLTGNAASATKLATARTINGTSFNGSANITTANWGTARTLTIGGTGKSVNGSANVSWTLAEIGAAAASHDHAVATTAGAGFMSAEDKTKLNGIAEGANNFSLPAGANGQVLKHNGTTWVAGTDNDTTYSGMSSAEANAGTATSNRVITAAVLKGAIETHAPVQTTISGNAGTATKLATARTINGVSFDGTANITVADGTKLPLTGGALNGSVVFNAVSSNGAIRVSADIGNPYAEWTVGAKAAVQIDMPNTLGAYLVWRGTRWGARHVAAMHIYEGNNTVTMSVGSTNNYVWDSGGNFTATGNVTAYSDRRIKTNIQRIPNALAKVKKLKGVTFDRTDQECPRQTGLIAQDVKRVLPEAVLVAKNEKKTLTVNYGALAGLLAESIKELDAKLEKAMKVIERQGKLIAKLKA